MEGFGRGLEEELYNKISQQELELNELNRKVDELYSLLYSIEIDEGQVDLGDIYRRLKLLEITLNQAVIDVADIKRLEVLLNGQVNEQRRILGKRQFLLSLNKVELSKIVNIHGSEAQSRKYGLQDLGVWDASDGESNRFNLRGVSPPIVRSAITFPLLSQGYVCVVRTLSWTGELWDGADELQLVVQRDNDDAVNGYKYIWRGRTILENKINLLQKGETVIESLVLVTWANREMMWSAWYTTKSIDSLLEVDGTYDLTKIVPIEEDWFGRNGGCTVVVELNKESGPGELLATTTQLLEASLIDTTEYNEIGQKELLSMAGVTLLGMLVASSMEGAFLNDIAGEYRRELDAVENKMTEGSPAFTSLIINLQQSVMKMQQSGAYLVENRLFINNGGSVSKAGVVDLGLNEPDVIEYTVARSPPQSSWDPVNVYWTNVGLSDFTGDRFQLEVTGNDGSQDTTFETQVYISLDHIINTNVLMANNAQQTMGQVKELGYVDYKETRGEGVLLEAHYTLTTQHTDDQTNYRIMANCDDDYSKGGAITLTCMIRVTDGLPLTSSIEPGVGGLKMTSGTTERVVAFDWSTKVIIQDGQELLHAIGTVDLFEVFEIEQRKIITLYPVNYKPASQFEIKVRQAASDYNYTLESGEYQDGSELTAIGEDKQKHGLQLAFDYRLDKLKDVNGYKLSDRVIKGWIGDVGSLIIVLGNGEKDATFYLDGERVELEISGELCNVKYIKDPLGIGIVDSYNVDQAILNSYLAYLDGKVSKLAELVNSQEERLNLLEKAIEGTPLSNVANILAGVVPMAGSGAFAMVLTVTVAMLNAQNAISDMIANGVSFGDVFQTIAAAFSVLMVTQKEQMESGINLEPKADVIEKTVNNKTAQVESFNFDVEIGGTVLTPSDYNTQTPKLRHEYVEIKGLKNSGVYNILNPMMERVANNTETPSVSTAVKVLQKMKLLPYHERTLITKFEEDDFGEINKEILMTAIGDGNACQYANVDGGYSGGQIKGNPGYLSFKYEREEDRWALMNYESAGVKPIEIVAAAGEGKLLLKQGIVEDEDVERVFTKERLQSLYEDEAKYYVDHVDTKNTKDEEYAVFRTREVDVNLATGQFEGLKAFLDVDSSKFGYKLFGHNCQNYCTSIQHLLLTGQQPSWMSEAGYQAYIEKLRNAVS